MDADNLPPMGMIGIQNKTSSQVADDHFLYHAWKIAASLARKILSRQLHKFRNALSGFLNVIKKMLVDVTLLC